MALVIRAETSRFIKIKNDCGQRHKVCLTNYLLEKNAKLFFFFFWRKGGRRKRERKRKRKRKAIKGRQPQYFFKMLFLIVWLCIRLTPLMIDCEVVRYRLAQVRQNSTATRRPAILFRQLLWVVTQDWVDNSFVVCPISAGRIAHWSIFKEESEW